MHSSIVGSTELHVISWSILFILLCAPHIVDRVVCTLLYPHIVDRVVYYTLTLWTGLCAHYYTLTCVDRVVCTLLYPHIVDRVVCALLYPHIVDRVVCTIILCTYTLTFGSSN